MRLSTRIITTAALLALLGPAALADTTWTGAEDSLWTNANNWTAGVPDRASTDTATFDNGSAPAGTITMGSTSTTRPRNTNFYFAAGAASHTLTGADYIDNGSNGRFYSTQAGMTTNQAIEGQIRCANFSITMDGSGDLSLDRFYGTNTWGDTYVNTTTWAVNDAAATLTIGDFQQQRRYSITKSGAGTLVIDGAIDWEYGFNGSTFVSTRLITSGAAGTIDLSAATINFESNTSDPLDTGEVYQLVNYANATLIGAGTTGFGAVTGDLPADWEVFNDTANSQIVLQYIPEPATMALLGAGAVALLRRRRG